MKQGIGIFFFVISLFLQKQGNGQSRIEIDFNQHWAFNYFTEEKNEKLKGIEEPGYDDSKWPAVAVPHTWSTFETTGEVHPYIKNASPKDDPYWWNGMGWYRKKFIVDPKYKDKKIFIEFEAVQKNCRVYINGKIVGEHNGGFTGFSCDLTDFINFGKENTVVVAVDNAQADDYKIAPMDAGNWDIYGGIYRNVKMLITDRIYIPYQGSALHEGGTFITTPLVSDQKADVDIKTWVRNEYNISKDCKLVTTILDKSGRQVAQLTATKKIQPGIIEQFQQQAGLKDPLLWSPDAPDLYEAISELWMGGNKVDTYRTVFGVREFRWDFVTDELYLNGKKTNLQGFFRHQEYPWVGDAMPDFIHEMDLRDMKENLNCNFVRAGHYPTAPYIYNRCDQMGLITVGDLPNVKDKDFSFLNQQQQAIELVRQQRNHPSIFLWNLGDETNRAADSRFVRDEDTTRYISCRDCSGVAPGKYISLSSDHIRMAKMLRCTVRGWYDDDDMKQRPENQQHAGNEQYQHEVARSSKDGTSNNRIDQPNLIVWLYEDHGCDREYQNSPLLHYNPKGWVDNYRVPKYVYYLWQANYAKKPMLFVHPQFWRKQYVGQKHDFDIDSNCDSVELKINGRSLGIQQPAAENFHTVQFKNVPVQKATLTAIGYKKGQKVISELKMAGDASQLVLTVSHKKISAKQNAVAIITADITDTNGVHVYGAKNTIRWEVSGPATLVGPSVYESDFYKNMEMEGTLYIDMPVSNLIRSTGKPGVITVRVFAAGIAAGEITLEAVADESLAGDIQSIPLTDVGREIVTQNPKQVRMLPATYPVVIKHSNTAIVSSSTSVSVLRKLVEKNLSENNTIGISVDGLDALLNKLTQAAVNSKGKLSAASINYHISNYNRFAYLLTALNERSLPDQLKKDWKEYYATELIIKGNDPDLLAEKNKIASIPANATIVIAANNDVASLVAQANKSFAGWSDEKKESYLYKLSELNPWVYRSSSWTGDSKLKTKKEVIVYSVTPGKAVVLPE